MEGLRFADQSQIPLTREEAEAKQAGQKVGALSGGKFQEGQAQDNSQKALNPSTSLGDRQNLPADGQLIALIDGGVMTIPLGIGTITIIVVAAGWIAIYWEDLSGVVQELLEIAIDVGADIAEEAERVTNIILNHISTSIGLAANLVEALRSQIEGHIVGALAASRGTPRNNRAQNAQAEAAKREVEKRLGRKLDLDEEEEFHREVHGKNYGFWEMVFVGLEMFGASLEELEKLKNKVPEEWWPED